MKIRFYTVLLLLAGTLTFCTGGKEEITDEKTSEQILLKDFRPQSIYNIPRTKVERAKFQAIDIHAHQYASTPELVDEWVKTMDETGIEKTIILATSTGTLFDSIYDLYMGRYSDRFEVWCGFDYTGYDEPGYGPAAVKELERCFKVGATGVGELGDKGKGMFFSSPGPKAWGMHPDDPRMDPLWEKCAELNLPVSLHVADPIWMYEPMDSTNDGMMNAVNWRLDNQPDIVDNQGMYSILENTLKKHPNTTFVACHLANQSHDLNALGDLFDKYPNLYADISARFAETAAIPRFAGKFYEKYQDRLLYGTDMGTNQEMYEITFRVLESEDEHFYEPEISSYHWTMNGFGLPENILKKVYRDNAISILHN